MLVLIPSHSKAEKGTRLTDCHFSEEFKLQEVQGKERRSFLTISGINFLLLCCSVRKMPYILYFLCRIVDYSVKDSMNIR